ncbi:amidohydrolase [Klebsiella pneumoniae]|nr:amidohydrolase [Klebsiella pneumoniae]
MEAIFQFVDEVVEAQRDTYCAIADDIWDHPETRLRSSGQPNGWPTPWRRKVFSSPAMPAGSRMPLSPASVRANRSLPCSANLTPWRDSASRPTARNRRLDTGSQRPRLWAQSARHRGIRRGGRRQRLAAAARRQRHSALLRLSRRGRRFGKNLYGARRVV